MLSPQAHVLREIDVALSRVHRISVRRVRCSDHTDQRAGWPATDDRPLRSG